MIYKEIALNTFIQKRSRYNCEMLLEGLFPNSIRRTNDRSDQLREQKTTKDTYQEKLCKFLEAKSLGTTK